MLDQPVVKRTMVLEFEGADRMGDPLDRVRLAMREIIGRVDAPSAAGTRMGGVQYAVQYRVAQVHISRGHVDLGAQHPPAVRELAAPHAADQIKLLSLAP